LNLFKGVWKYKRFWNIGKLYYASRPKSQSARLLFPFPMQPTTFFLLIAELHPLAGRETLTRQSGSYLVTRPLSSTVRPCCTQPPCRPRLCLGCMSCSTRNPPSSQFPYPHDNTESQMEIIPKDDRNGENFQILNQTRILPHVFMIFS
jgi:hypothetical protein